jgi:hypothetical protein
LKNEEHADYDQKGHPLPHQRARSPRRRRRGRSVSCGDGAGGLQGHGGGSDNVARRGDVEPGCFPMAGRGGVVRSEDTLRAAGTGSRRGFLIVAAVALAGLLPAAAWTIHRRGPATPRWLRQLVPFVHAAATIGRRYLGTRPAEASAPWLAERLLGAGALDVPSDRNLAEIRHRLRTLRLADFRSGDLVYIDGWALTRTEVRLMALIAMCSNADAC